MSADFYTILTNIGKAKIANANVLGNKINFVKFRLGDGGGSYYNPVESQEQLKNVVWEGVVNSVSVDEENKNWIVIQVIIPGDVGGFTIREAGVFDDEDNLIAIGKYPETYKPVIKEGAAKDLAVKMILEVSNSENVTLKVDPTVILATKNDLLVLESKMTESLKRHIADNRGHVYYGVAEGSDNVYSVDIAPTPANYKDGFAISVKIPVASTGKSTINVNGLGAKGIKKANGKDVTNLKTGGIYTLRYDSSTGNFILQGEGGEGTAIAKNVLKGKTFTNDEDTFEGTMPERGTVTQALGINGVLNLPEGHYDSIKVTQNIPFLNPNWNDIWETHEYTVGTHMYNNGANYALLKVPNGHYINGCNWVGAYTPDLRPENIVAGKNVLGVGGSATVESLGGRYYKTGTSTCTKSGTEFITNIAQYLSFTPRIIVGYVNTSIGVRYFYWNNTPDGKVLLYYMHAFRESAGYTLYHNELNASSIVVFSSGNEYVTDVHWTAIS